VVNLLGVFAAARWLALGPMGIHRNVIHPPFGNFILLSTILVGAEMSAHSQELDYNPCLECKLCVAAVPPAPSARTARS
jgi:epoxyqueuosine reductase QueG